MSDMRQKLLPIFLEEAERKIVTLNDFLSAVGGVGKSQEDLETAFRAAHTLKGTAALVQAESICLLSGHIEGLLEGHYEQNRFPSDVEYEAMKLALEHLNRLLDSVKNAEIEPSGLVAEAEMALNIATAMPGHRRLAELLTPVLRDDPFAEDSDFDPLIDPSATLIEVAPAVDPFAEDPSCEIELSAPSLVEDPFGDDPELESEYTLNQEPLPSADPFHNEPDNMVVHEESEKIGVKIISAIDPSRPIAVADPFADDPVLDPAVLDSSAGESGTKSVSDLLDPFADDPDLVDNIPYASVPELPRGENFAEQMRKRIEKESALGTAERLASTLLNSNSVEVVEHKYTCCRFRVAKKNYYLPIANTVEIADLPRVVSLPLAPPVVKGLVNVHGRVLPLIDLTGQTGVAAQCVVVHKMVVANAGGEQLAFMTDGIPALSVEVLGEKIDILSFVAQFRAGAS